MTDEEFEKYLQDSMDEMEEKQESLEKSYGIGHLERFEVDYELSELSFFDGGVKKVTAKIIPIASHVPEKQNLQWAWANESFPSEIRSNAAIAKQLGELTGYELFTNERIECDEDMAWEINAMVCKLIGALGIYRVPHGALNMHVVLMEVSGAANK
ncbi:MAG: DUF6882 domain-containing protein [Candidatus Thiodiazotropha sp.]